MSKKKPDPITQSAFAKQINRTRASISKAIKVGVLPTIKVNGKIMINPVNRVVKEYAKNAMSVKVSDNKTTKNNNPGKVSEPSSHILGLKGGRKYTGALRTAILKRDGNKCVLCGKTPADDIRLEVDHIIEFEDGGETTYENGQTVCAECNKGKSLLKHISDKDELISLTEFGRRVGAHRNKIAEAIKSGIIKSHKINGKINYTREIIKWYDHKKKQPKPPDIVDEKDIPDYIKEMVDSGDLSFKQFISLSKSEADKIKIYEQLKQIRQDRLQKRKELIDIKFIKLIFGKVYDIDTNEFMAIKTRLKPNLSKIFKTNDDAVLLEAEKAIDEELWETLSRIKFEFDKFLEKLKK